MVYTQEKSSPSSEGEAESSSKRRLPGGPSNRDRLELLELLAGDSAPEEAAATEAECLEFAWVGVLPDCLGVDHDAPLGSLAELLGIELSAMEGPVGQCGLGDAAGERVPVESDGSRAQAVDGDAENATYLDQHDNPAAGSKDGGSQCSATSFTMGLMNIYDGEAEKFFDAAEPLLAALGQSVDRDGQPEQAVTTLLMETDWEAAYAAHPNFFEHNPDWRSWTPGDDVIKSPNAQAYIASRFEGIDDALNIASESTTVTDGEQSAEMDFNGRWDWARSAWEDGGQVSFQGGFTRGGHVVHINSFKEDHMVIDDPSGMYLGRSGYLQNGQAPTASQQASGQVTFEYRSEDSPELKEAFKEGQASDHWGARNHYSKAELDAVDALKWVLVIKPRQLPG